MLLPSSFESNYDEPISRRFHTPLISPPHSPPTSPFATLFTTCRNLQSILSTPTHQLPPSPLSSHQLLKVPTPKIRLRSQTRKTAGSKPAPRIRMRVPARSVSPSPNGSGSKRRRSESDFQGKSIDGEGGKSEVAGSEISLRGGMEEENNGDSMMADQPSTPKRSRIAPAEVPFGLTRRDFHDLHSASMPARPLKKLNLKHRSSTTSTSSRYQRKMAEAINPNNAPGDQSMDAFISEPIPFAFDFQSPSTPAGSKSGVRNGSAGSLSGTRTTPTGSFSGIHTTPTGSNSGMRASPAASQQEVSPFLNNVASAQANDSDNTSAGEDSSEEAEGEWTKEDDKMLVELVLEKMKLSKAEWEECARGMGKRPKDRKVLKKRWNSFLSADAIGLRPAQRRSSLFSSLL